MTGLHLVAMPKWGLSMEEGVVVGWHRQVGDNVDKGQDLVDVETTKITNCVEVPFPGVLLRALAAPGETIGCGRPLAVIGPPDTDDAAVDRFIADHSRGADASDAVQGTALDEPVVASVDVGGVAMRIRYLDVGAGADTLVLLHGFGGDLDNWMLTQPALATAGRVIAIDLPGHGGSDKRVGDGSAGSIAEVIGLLLDQIAPGKVHLVAHSFGAVVARKLAAASPGRIASFTAIAPADLGTVERAYIDAFIGARRRSELTTVIGMLFADPGLATREMAEALLRTKRLDGVDAALRAIDAANFSQAGPDKEAIAFWESNGPAGQIIWGSEDRVVPPAGAAMRFPGVTHHLITGAGHMPHLEQAGQVNTMIAAHVARHGAAPVAPA